MAKGAFYRDGDDIRRKGTSKRYAQMLEPDIKATTKLVNLLNGIAEPEDADLCFLLAADSSHRLVCCTNITTDETIYELGFAGDSAQRVWAMLERLSKVTAPSCVDKHIDEAGDRQI